MHRFPVTIERCTGGGVSASSTNNWTADQITEDDKTWFWGTDSDFGIEWDTGQTNDALLFMTSGSNNVMMVTKANEAVDYGLATSTDPTLYILSADGAALTDYVKIWHDQASGRIDVGTGTLNVVSNLTVAQDLGLGDGDRLIFGNFTTPDVGGGS